MASYEFNIYSNWGQPRGGSHTTNTHSETVAHGELHDDGDDGIFEVGETLTCGSDTFTFEGSMDIDGELFLVTTNDCTGERVLFGHSASPESVDWPPVVNKNSFDAVNTPNCFAAGTMIATPLGERAVETLEIGDEISVAGGGTTKVLWLARQTVHKRFTPAERFVPVRVKAGALGAGVPHADLVLTADHALILDGLAINASALVNGTTICYEPMAALAEHVTYFHVETEAHEVILANGAAAESYVDYVRRQGFDNYQEYLDLYGKERTIPEMAMPRVSAARLVPPAIKARLAPAKAA
ncbi:Hint domain-containing protein [Poseidonocella sp. HB161398]|uniref:Hint domain-containing protein n=1 Tax=Poseidonocella sp. HB161398 TaxID=2320855 RepID=UPI00110838F6|nr:Hint domain-containing protein [Poseidonocella sp. HB161398]